MRTHIVETALTLRDNPLLGEKLTGEFRRFRSLHTKFQNVHYRIGYEVNDERHEVVVRAVDVRENFYKRLTEMKLKPTG